MPVAKTYCRLCPGFCAMDVVIEDGCVVEVRGDKTDPVTRGYTCIKGLQNPDLMNGSGRLLRPLVCGADGALHETSMDGALDDVAARLSGIIAQHGPRSVGIFLGTQCWFNALSAPAAQAFAAAIDTPCVFGTMTIDQSAKWVANERMGSFNGGPQRFEGSDVWLLMGTNPLVSVMGGPSTSGFANQNPAKALRDAKANGMKLIVIDPRRTETARHADLFIQPRPGHDAEIAAAILHVVLREHWHDREFCDRYVSGVEDLRAAVAPFTPECVAASADVPAGQLVEAARIFAAESRRGRAGTGTGPNMGPHSNIAEHLVQCLNVLCGRFLREGELIPNPGVLQPARPRHADVTPAVRSYENGPKSRRLGLGRINGEMMSAELADEMLMPGEGRIRALICVGGNPAVALPEQSKAVAALKSLDLLVTIDPRLSATARLADYVITPTLAFERHDHTGYLEPQFQVPYARYAEPVVKAPADAELIDDWQVFWEFARRAGIAMQLGGLVARAGEATPDTETMLAATSANSRVPLATVRASHGGEIFPVDMRVLPARPDRHARLELIAPDIAAEIAAVAEDLNAPRADGELLLTVRRAREFINSLLTEDGRSRARIPENPAYLHPEDLDRLGFSEGERVTVRSASGALTAIATADPDLRPGLVSMTHCWGLGIDDPAAVPEATSALVSSNTNVQTINGMPVMTAIPVRVERAGAPSLAPRRSAIICDA
jgi:anaerobic selenocysteine-containing dehydrogenase